MRKDLCILLSTCRRYLPVAAFTRRVIEQWWEPRPPVFLCGVEASDALPLRDDSADWMAVTLSAVEDLQSQGFVWAYLILDDHPPMGPCDARLLNTILPNQAMELDAMMIGLLGWGQRRPMEGTDLGKSWDHLSHNAATYRWKFSLHPALWNLEKLATLLHTRKAHYPASEHTPWNFERHRDEPGGPLPQALLEATYRVHGVQSTGMGWRDIVRDLGLFGFDGYRYLLRKLRGQAARDAFDRTGLWLYFYYRGPYPLFWSGTMRQGKPSKEFGDFLRWTGRKRMASDWAKVVRELEGLS